MGEAVFHLFVSSPGDVAAERARAEAVVEKLNAEFKDRARFDAEFWEDHFYSAHESFQKQIPEAADFDLVVALFRARLGSPLPEEFPTLPGGEPYPSGTAYEVLSAVAKRRGGAPLPDIYVFRYPRAPQFSADDPDRGEIDAQWTALKGFFERWFETAGGQFVAGFQSYDTTDDFAERIEACLRQWLAKRGIFTREIWDRARLGSPFPGLAAFEADREHVFFGRDLAIRQASDRLRKAKTPFLLILGASGAGKSSLLRAGLLPKLTRPGAIPEIDLFRPALITPGLDPFAELSGALLAPETLGGELTGGRFADKSALAKALAGDPATAAALIGEALDKAAEARRVTAHFDTPRPARLLLAVDQAERLFTETPVTAAAFASLLQALAGGIAYVILTLRADAYAHFQACAPLLALRAAGATLDLVPPTAAELEDIVMRPVAACEPLLAFGPSDPPLGQRLVGDAQGGDALPLLQMTLERLYKAQKARDDGILRAQDYKGVSAAVTESADAAMAHLGPGGRDALDALVAGLVADVAPDPVTATSQPVVVALDRDAFVKGRPERAALIDAFVEARLLTLEGGARLRPTHDALLRIWPEAATRVAELSALIRARHALAPLARAWAESGPGEKPGHLQLSAPLLASGQQLEARFGEDLGAPLRGFIAGAEEAEAAERTRESRRRRVIFGTTLSALVVMTGLAGAAVSQWREAVAQRAVAERNLALATNAANSLVFDIAQKFRDVSGVPLSLVKAVLDRALDLQQKLLGSGQSSPDLLDSEAAALDETSKTLLARGDTEGAFESARKAANILEGLSTQHPGRSQYNRDLLVSYADIGDVEVRQGQLPRALESYRAGLAIAKRFADSDPSNADSQRDLAASYTRIGVVEVNRDQLVQALESHRAALAIVERLAKSDPGNGGWQRDLASCYGQIGDVEVKQGHLEQALESHRAGLAIVERLAKSDPGNARAQSDLSILYSRVGNIEVQQDQLPQALESFRVVAEIVARLAKSDPGNADWQRDLSVSHEEIGNVEVKQGQLPQALDSYRSSLAIREPLAKSDPSNAVWQRDLSTSYEEVGDVEAAQHELRPALDSYRASLAIRERLAESNPGYADWQRDLAMSHSKIGAAEVAQGQLEEALDSYRASLAIHERLAKSNPGNVNWQLNLSNSYVGLGSVYIAQKDNAKAREAIESGRAIIARLVALSPDRPGLRDVLDRLDQFLTVLKP
jgi:tetratricopeptide (TPR) repeat protein